MIKRRDEKHPGDVHQDRKRNREAADPGPQHAQTSKMHPNKGHKAPGIHGTGRMGTDVLKIAIVIGEPVDKHSPARRWGDQFSKRSCQNSAL